MGFGASFRKWIKLFYTDIRSSIIVNGYTTKPFCPSQGVRQGCPLLYILTMEVLAVSVRRNPAIIGLSIPGVPDLPVLSLYADDTSVVVSTDAAITAVFETYHLFERASGAKINLDKCEGLWLGSWWFRLGAPVPIRWNSDKIKVLGVFIGPGDLEEANWRPRINAVSNCLSSWHTRSLSYQGKALVINALVLSRVWYVASLIHMPPWVLRELNSLCFRFFWSGKRDLVAHAVVCQPTESGGFSVTHTYYKTCALLLQWVRRFLTSPNAWVSLMTFGYFDRFGASPIDVFSSPSDFEPSLLPPFYCSLLKAWLTAGGCFSPSLNSLAISDSSAASFSCKSVYKFILSSNVVSPHCVEKFRPAFGGLHWTTTWKQQSQSLIYVASPLAPSISLRHMLFGFSADEFSAYPVFLRICCVCANL